MNKMLYGLTLSSLLLISCASVPPANTPSGNAEITLTNIRPDCVRSAFLNVFVDKGYAIRSSTETQIVAGKVSQNFAANVLLGTRFGGAPEERITALFIPQGRGEALRVVVSGSYVSNQGTAYERIQPVGVTQAEQDQFVAVKSSIEDQCRN